MLELPNVIEVSILRSSLIPAIIGELFGDFRKFYRSEAVYYDEGLSYLLGFDMYEGWNFNSGNYLFTTDTK